MIFSHLGLLSKKSQKTAVRDWKATAAGVLKCSIAVLFIFIALYAAKIKDPSSGRITTRYGGNQLATLEHRIGSRLKGTDTLKWLCGAIPDQCKGIREELSAQCREWACFAFEIERTGQYMLIKKMNSSSLHAVLVNSEFVESPNFNVASEEYERNRIVPYGVTDSFHRFVNTVPVLLMQSFNWTSNIDLRYLKEGEYAVSSSSILFDSSHQNTRFIVSALILLLPVIASLNMAAGLGDERNSQIKTYLLTMGISRVTYLLHHVIDALAKNVFFFVITSIVVFYPNWSFVCLFCVTYILYFISCLSLTIMITSVVHNHKLYNDVLSIGLPSILALPVVFKVTRTRVALSILACFNPGYALFDALDSLRESSLKGGHIDFFSDFPYVLPLGAILLIQILSTVILIFLAVLVDYLVSSAFNPMKIVSRYRKLNGTDEDERNVQGVFEEYEHDKKATIKIQNVHKTYTSTGERALRGANLDIFHNEITIILGQNGAGKSTMFDTITGSALPTSGSIDIDYPMHKNDEGQDEQFKRIGLCPQYSPIFNRLTVMEHLQFFAQLGDEKDWENKALEFISLLRLDQYKHTFASELSGGNKRKLVIAMALIGKSDVILMDEPTAGVDTESRAIIKKFLSEKRDNKTLVITTHYTDEAEDLGDRVCIMAKGKIVCTGTSSFLGQKLGTGYDMRCVVRDKDQLDATADEVLRLSHAVYTEKGYEILPLKTSIKLKHGEEFTLSVNAVNKAEIFHFIVRLENDQEKIGLASYGMSTAPLEQAFLEMAERTGSTLRREKVDRAMQDVTAESKNRATPKMRTINSLGALLYKRLCYEWRNKFYQCIFAIIIGFSIWMSKSAANFVEPSDEFDLLKLHQCGRIGFANAPEMMERFQQLAVERGECLVVEQVADVDEWYKNDHFRRPPILGAIEKSGNNYVVAMARNRKIYEPYIVNLIYKAVIGDMFDLKLSFQKNPNVTLNQDVLNIMYKFFLMLIQCMAVTRFVKAYVIEQEKGYSHLQMLTGVSKILYWIGHFIIDSFIFSLFYIYLYALCRYFDFIPHALIDILGQSTLCFAITIMKLAILCRCFVSKNTAVSTVYILLVLSFVIMLPLYIKIQSEEPKFCLEKSFPLFLDPYAAVIAYEMKKAGDGPSIYVILFVQLAILIAVFCAFESRSLRRFFHRSLHRKSCVPTSRDNPGGEIELLPMCERGEPEEEAGVDARPQGARNIVLEADNITKSYSLGWFAKKAKKMVMAVRGVTMAVDQNECFGLLGHNGAGKSTTFKILTGQIFADSGEAKVSGVDCMKQALIGYCPQDDALINQLTGREHLTILAALHGYQNFFRVARLLIECVDMENDCDKIFKNLSGGQKRKFSVCASILAMSKLIVLDEPTTGIDPMVRNDIWSLLRSIRDYTNTAIVLTSHSMNEVEALCSRIAVMKQGLITRHGTPQTLVSKHGDFYRIEFRAPSVDPEAKEAQIRASAHDLLHGITFVARVLTRYIFTMERKPDERNDYSTVFQRASIIQQETGADDFMVVQSNLEDTFLAMADE